jgi:hypothetical protein
MPGPTLERIELTPEEQAPLEARGAAPDRTSCRGQSRSLTGNEVDLTSEWSLVRTRRR